MLALLADNMVMRWNPLWTAEYRIYVIFQIVLIYEHALAQPVQSHDGQDFQKNEQKANTAAAMDNVAEADE